MIEQIKILGDVPPGILFVNGTEGLSEYKKIDLPENWEIAVMPYNIGLCASLNWFYAHYPDEKYYGLITDDEFVYTKGWAKRITDAAGDWNISHGNEGWQSMKRIHSLTTLGGELVRSIGYMAPEGLWHWFIDDFHEKIALWLNLRRFCYDVKTEHKHYLSGKSEKDATYVAGESRKEKDEEIYNNWVDTEFLEVVARIKRCKNDS